MHYWKSVLKNLVSENHKFQIPCHRKKRIRVSESVTSLVSEYRSWYFKYELMVTCKSLKVGSSVKYKWNNRITGSNVKLQHRTDVAMDWLVKPIKSRGSVWRICSESGGIYFFFYYYLVGWDLTPIRSLCRSPRFVKSQYCGHILAYCTGGIYY
jgi:hypothetical protein